MSRNSCEFRYAVVPRLDFSCRGKRPPFGRISGCRPILKPPPEFIRRMRPTSLVFRLFLALAFGVICVPAAAKPPRFMIEATVKGQYVEGGPLAWSEKKVVLLARD